jgi:hypothetical protein
VDRENQNAMRAVAGLGRQGLTVTLQNSHNRTWSGGGIYTGYIANSGELVELRRAKKVNIRGINELD